MLLGNPNSAHVFFALYGGIGLVVGGIVFGLCACPGMRREQFRQWGAMPRLGMVLGCVVAGSVLAIAWNTVYRNFYGIRVDGEEIRLDYIMPARTVVIPFADVVALEKQWTLSKGANYHIALETRQGRYVSVGMNRQDFDTAWAEVSNQLHSIPKRESTS